MSVRSATTRPSDALVDPLNAPMARGIALRRTERNQLKSNLMRVLMVTRVPDSNTEAGAILTGFPLPADCTSTMLSLVFRDELQRPLESTRVFRHQPHGDRLPAAQEDARLEPLLPPALGLRIPPMNWWVFNKVLNPGWIPPTSWRSATSGSKSASVRTPVSSASLAAPLHDIPDDDLHLAVNLGHEQHLSRRNSIS